MVTWWCQQLPTCLEGTVAVLGFQTPFAPVSDMLNTSQGGARCVVPLVSLEPQAPTAVSLDQA